MKSCTNRVSVRLGEHDLNSDTDCAKSNYGDEYCSDTPINVPVAETIAHESYDPLGIDQHHDIALLRLIRNVEFTGGLCEFFILNQC